MPEINNMPYIEITSIHINTKLEDTGIFAGLEKNPKTAVLSRDMLVNRHFKVNFPLSNRIAINYDEIKFTFLVYYDQGSAFQVEMMWHTCVSIKIIGDLNLINPNLQEMI